MTTPRRSRDRIRSTARKRIAGRTCAIAILASIGIGCAPSTKRSGYGRELYQWSDASGEVRYTTYLERVPVRRLHTMQRVIAGRSAEENAAGLRGVRMTQGSGGAPESAAQNASGSAYLSDLDERIATLEVAIERDQEILKILISDPDAAPNLSDSDELKEVGLRLPQRQRELRALREERARAVATDER